MNAWLQMLGIDGIKPFLTALLLPPVPWLALMVVGAFSIGRRRWPGRVLVLLGAVLAWASCTQAAGVLLTPLAPVPAAGADRPAFAENARGPAARR